MNPLCPDGGGSRITSYVGIFIPNDATSHYRMQQFFQRYSFSKNSHDLAPFDYHLFGSLKDELRGRRFAVFFQEQSRFSTLRLLSFGFLKDAVRGRRFADDDELRRNVRGEFRGFSQECYATGIQRLTQRWKGVLIMKENLWENDLELVKDESMI